MENVKSRRTLAPLAVAATLGLALGGCESGPRRPATPPAGDAPRAAADAPYVPDATKVLPAAPDAGAPAAAAVPQGLAAQVEAGRPLYQANCQVCHRVDGTGTPRIFPPLAGSDYLMADEARAISVVLHGLAGPITVNGQEYNLNMPAQGRLSDGDVALILTYARNSWGNQGGPTTAEEVAAVRAKGPPAR
jgi:mono/diheme cytochrome c family protein